MHTIKITPNLLAEYQCTSGKFIRLLNRIESKKIDSVARIESKLFLPEMECSTVQCVEFNYQFRHFKMDNWFNQWISSKWIIDLQP